MNYYQSARIIADVIAHNYNLDLATMWLDPPGMNLCITGKCLGKGGGMRIVYSYAKMVEYFKTEMQCSEEDAVEFIEFNTIRTIECVSKSDYLMVPMVTDDYKGM